MRSLQICCATDWSLRWDLVIGKDLRWGLVIARTL